MRLLSGKLNILKIASLPNIIPSNNLVYYFMEIDNLSNTEEKWWDNFREDNAEGLLPPGFWDYW